jgi:hypothetical protein
MNMSKSKKMHVLIITFSYVIFQNFQWIRNQHQVPRFYSHIAKIHFFIILSLFANFEVKPGQNGSKKRKMYFVNVS